MSHSFARSNQAVGTVGRSLLIGGAVTMGLEIAAFEYQKHTFGAEVDCFPAAAGGGVAIGAVCILAAVICLVTAATGRRSQAYIDEISHPTGDWEENEKFARRMPLLGALALLLPILLAAGILAPYIIHNKNTHEANVKKRWETVKELDAAFPGLRGDYLDKTISVPDYKEIIVLYDYRRGTDSTAYDQQEFIVHMDCSGRVFEIEYDLYNKEGAAAPAADGMDAFVEEVKNGLDRCGSVDSIYATPVPERAVSRAKKDMTENKSEMDLNYGTAYTMEGGVACQYSIGSSYEIYTVSTDPMVIENAEHEDKEVAKAESD